jgi:hypothetical protein
MVRTTLVAAVVEKDWIKDSRDRRVIKVIVPERCQWGSKRGKGGNPGTRTMRVRNKE